MCAQQVFAVDDVTLDWLARRTQFLNHRGLPGVPSDADAAEGAKLHPRCDKEQLAGLRAAVADMESDADASYAVTIKVDLGSVRPHVSGPNNVKTMASVTEMAERKVKVDKAYLVSCVNSRLEDLAAAADVVRGRQVGTEPPITFGGGCVCSPTARFVHTQFRSSAGGSISFF